MPPPRVANNRQGGMALFGTFRATLDYKGRSAQANVYVFDALAQPILGRQACRELGLLSELQKEMTTTVMTTMTNKHSSVYNVAYTDGERQATLRRLMDRFPRIVDGVCRPMAGGPVVITIEEGATPHQVYSTRPIPLHRMQAFREELQLQIDAGIIEPANDDANSSPWAHPMMLVAKKDPGAIRITVDMRELNKVTVRPVRTMLSPAQVVAQIPPEARFFTVVDGLKGFHQLELHPDS
jgi:hypothetical protein